MHDGRVRAYIVAKPHNHRPGNPTVVVLHGGTQSMRTILVEESPQRRWLDLAALHGLLVIVPNGWNTGAMSGVTDRQTWNDLRPADGTGISEEDDAGFIAAAIDMERSAFGIRDDSTFVTGSSNGGMMTFRMLYECPERFAAGGAFIANMPEAHVPLPSVGRPVMIMNGDQDPLMPWTGGTVGLNGAPVRSTAQSVAYWRQANGAAMQIDDSLLLPDVDPLDDSRILFAGFGAPGSSTPSVVLYRVINGGHAVPVLPTDPQRPLDEDLLGNLCRDARGIDLAFGFFGMHLPAPCLGDADGDGVVGFGDLNDVLNSLGARLGDAAFLPSADFDRDDVVDFADLNGVLSRFGQDCD